MYPRKFFLYPSKKWLPQKNDPEAKLPGLTLYDCDFVNQRTSTLKSTPAGGGV